MRLLSKKGERKKKEEKETNEIKTIAIKMFEN